MVHLFRFFVWSVVSAIVLLMQGVWFSLSGFSDNAVFTMLITFLVWADGALVYYHFGRLMTFRVVLPGFYPDPLPARQRLVEANADLRLAA